jgi:hypothetical protein
MALRHLDLNVQDIRDLAARYGLRGLKGLRRTPTGRMRRPSPFTWPGLDARKVRIYPKDFVWEGTARPVLWPSLSLIRKAFPDADGSSSRRGSLTPSSCLPGHPRRHPLQAGPIRRSRRAWGGKSSRRALRRSSSWPTPTDLGWRRVGDGSGPSVKTAWPSGSRRSYPWDLGGRPTGRRT